MPSPLPDSLIEFTAIKKRKNPLDWLNKDIEVEITKKTTKDLTATYTLSEVDPNAWASRKIALEKNIAKENLKYFSGNYMFGSLNSCRGNNKSRRDDIESLFYLIIYLFNGNYLPWKDFKGSFK